MIELLATALRGTVFPLATPICVTRMGKYLLFIAGSCVRHKDVHRAGKLQKFNVKPDISILTKGL